MKHEKEKWIIILIVGIILFVIPLIMGIYNSINGYSGLCWWICDYYYGVDALIDSILIYSYIFWPTYIIGVILIVFSIIKLRNKRNN